MSVFSTAASDNQTLQSDAADDSMEVDLPLQRSRAPVSSSQADVSLTSSLGGAGLPEDDIIPPGRIVTTATGKTIIEELDSPAIRKAKRVRRQRMAATLQTPVASTSAPVDESLPEAEPPSTAPVIEDPATSGPMWVDLPSSSTDPLVTPPATKSAGTVPNEAGDVESELSELSEQKTQRTAETTAITKSASVKPAVSDADRGRIILEDGQTLQDGTLGALYL